MGATMANRQRRLLVQALCLTALVFAVSEAGPQDASEPAARQLPHTYLGIEIRDLGIAISEPKLVPGVVSVYEKERGVFVVSSLISATQYGAGHEKVQDRLAYVSKTDDGHYAFKRDYAKDYIANGIHYMAGVVAKYEIAASLSDHNRDLLQSFDTPSVEIGGQRTLLECVVEQFITLEEMAKRNYVVRQLEERKEKEKSQYVYRAYVTRGENVPANLDHAFLGSVDDKVLAGEMTGKRISITDKPDLDVTVGKDDLVLAVDKYDAKEKKSKIKAVYYPSKDHHNFLPFVIRAIMEKLVGVENE